MTLKLWADPDTDGERSCCSPEAVLGARALAHSLGLPHLTLDLEDRFRAAVVDDFLAEHDARADAEPLRALQRDRALRRDAGAGRARSARARSSPATTRASSDDGEGPLLAARGRPAKDQTYMLAALRPELLGRAAVPARRADQARGARDRARGGAAGGREAREPGPLLPRGHEPRAVPRAPRRRRDRPARSSTARAACSAGTAATAASRSASAAGSAWPRGEPLYVLATDAAANRVVVGPASELATRTVRARAARSSPRRRPRRPREAPLPLRAGRRAASRRAGGGPTLDAELRRAGHGVAPGQTACLHGRRPRARPRHDRRRQPSA